MGTCARIMRVVLSLLTTAVEAAAVAQLPVRFRKDECVLPVDAAERAAAAVELLPITGTATTKRRSVPGRTRRQNHIAGPTNYH